MAITAQLQKTDIGMKVALAIQTLAEHYHVNDQELRLMLLARGVEALTNVTPTGEQSATPLQLQERLDQRDQQLAAFLKQALATLMLLQERAKEMQRLNQKLQEFLPGLGGASA